MCAHAELITFGTTGGIGCAHAKFITFGRAEGIGCVCAHAEFITFGRTEGIGCVPMQNLLLLANAEALVVCPCKIYYFWHN